MTATYGERRAPLAFGMRELEVAIAGQNETRLPLPRAKHPPAGPHAGVLRGAPRRGEECGRSVRKSPRARQRVRQPKALRAGRWSGPNCIRTQFGSVARSIARCGSELLRNLLNRLADDRRELFNDFRHGGHWSHVGALFLVDSPR